MYLCNRGDCSLAVETGGDDVLYGVRPHQGYWHAVDDVTYHHTGEIHQVITRCGHKFEYDDIATWAYDYSWTYAIGGCNRYCNYSIDVIGPWNPEQSK